MKHKTLAVGLFLALLGADSHAQTAKKYVCLSREMPGHKTENFLVQDIDKAVEETAKLSPPRDEIKILKTSNYICTRGDHCYVDIGDRIRLFKWYGHYILTRRHPGQLAEDAVIMSLNNSASRPNFLSGRDLLGNDYYLIYLGSDRCTYSTPAEPECRKYQFEIFPKGETRILTPEVSRAWKEVTANEQCISPAEPGGGSGEDPPEDPG